MQVMLSLTMPKSSSNTSLCGVPEDDIKIQLKEQSTVKGSISLIDHHSTIR